MTISSNINKNTYSRRYSNLYKLLCYIKFGIKKNVKIKHGLLYSFVLPKDCKMEILCVQCS